MQSLLSWIIFLISLGIFGRSYWHLVSSWKTLGIMCSSGAYRAFSLLSDVCIAYWIVDGAFLVGRSLAMKRSPKATNDDERIQLIYDGSGLT